MLKLLRAVAMVLVPTLAIVSCGEATNINGLIMTKPQKEAVDILLFKAQLAYDKGDFDLAEEYANKAYEINPNNEQAAILSGYIYLSKAGVDAFQLAKGLINKSSSSTSGGNASDALAPVAALLNISTADFSGNLGEIQKSSLTKFASYPIIKPNCAEDARPKLAALNNVNKAIQRVCPFVKEAVKVTSDSRHNSTNCVPSTLSLKLSSKSNFLWAFTHLAEALVFYSVFSYSTSNDGVSNLQNRVNTVSNLKPTSLTEIQELVSLSQELATSIEAVLPLPSAGGCSGKTNQMTALLNDLKATSLGFANLPGVPEKLTKSITAAIDKIDQFSKNIPNADQALQAQSDALKGQLTKSIAEKLGQKISDAKKDNPNVSDADIAKMCASFDSIAGAGTQTGQVTKPKECG